MAMFEVNTSPSDRQLRQFGLICLFAFPLLAWFWFVSTAVIVSAAVVGGVLALVGLVVPRFLKPVFVGLILITLPAGLVIGELILLLIYFGVFLPMSLVFRIIGRDTLQRRSTRETESFWIPREVPRSVRNYYRQF